MFSFDSDKMKMNLPNRATKIDLSDPSEVAFWSWLMHVSAGKLKQAERVVGPRLEDISDHLSSLRS